MPEISAHDLCKTRFCRRCEINDPDGKDGLCSFCRTCVERGIFIFPSPKSAQGNREARPAQIAKGYARFNDIEREISGLDLSPPADLTDEP